MHKLFRKGQKEAALKIRKHLQKRPSLDPHDPDYRRLKYIRDAADFALALYVRYNQKRLFLTGIMYTPSSIPLFFLRETSWIIHNHRAKGRSRRNQTAHRNISAGRTGSP